MTYYTALIITAFVVLMMGAMFAVCNLGFLNRGLSKGKRIVIGCFISFAGIALAILAGSLAREPVSQSPHWEYKTSILKEVFTGQNGAAYLYVENGDEVKVKERFAIGSSNRFGYYCKKNTAKPECITFGPDDIVEK